MSNVSDAAFAIVVGHEGDQLDTTRSDPGNWTGGVVGVGQLRGSKFGISAASYPNIVIADLTRDQAAGIFQTDFWDKVLGDLWPPALSLLVVDAEYNNGPGHAPVWLQLAAGLSGSDVDGWIGPETIAAVQAAIAAKGLIAVCAEFHARRIDFMGGLVDWSSFGLGWSRRLATLPYQALTMPTVAAPVPTVPPVVGA